MNPSMEGLKFCALSFQLDPPLVLKKDYLKILLYSTFHSPYEPAFSHTKHTRPQRGMRSAECFIWYCSLIVLCR